MVKKYASDSVRSIYRPIMCKKCLWAKLNTKFIFQNTKDKIILRLQKEKNNFLVDNFSILYLPIHLPMAFQLWHFCSSCSKILNRFERIRKNALLKFFSNICRYKEHSYFLVISGKHAINNEATEKYKAIPRLETLLGRRKIRK